MKIEFFRIFDVNEIKDINTSLSINLDKKQEKIKKGLEFLGAKSDYALYVKIDGNVCTIKDKLLILNQEKIPNSKIAADEACKKEFNVWITEIFSKRISVNPQKHGSEILDLTKNEFKHLKKGLEKIVIAVDTPAIVFIGEDIKHRYIACLHSRAAIFNAEKAAEDDVNLLMIDGTQVYLHYKKGKIY